MLSGINCGNRLPPFVFVAYYFDILTAQSGGAGNGTDALESRLDLQHRVNTGLTGAAGANGLRTEDKPGEQVTGNNLIGAETVALEHACVHQLGDRLVEFEFS